MLTCREIEKLVDIYLDGELDIKRCAEVYDHLYQCPSCSKLLTERIKETEMILNSFPVPELAPGFKERVMSSIAKLGCQPHISLWTERLPRRQWLAPVVASFLLIATASGIYTHNLSTKPKQVAKQTADRKTEENTVSNAEGYPLAGGSSSPVSSNDAKSETTPPATLKLLDENCCSENCSNYNPILERNQKETKTSLQARNLWSEKEAQSPTESEAIIAELFPPGYVVFTPTYLPAGYFQNKVIILSKDSDEVSDLQKPIVLLFTNPITSSEIKLMITPINPYKPVEPDPAEDFFTAENKIPEKYPSITWYAEKEGIHFSLTLSGDLPQQELKKIADSIK